MNTPLVRLAAFLLPLLAFAQTPSAAPAVPMAPDQPPVPPLETPALNPALPTLFIAGDSTAEHNRGGKIQGWGVPFVEYFDPAKINVDKYGAGWLFALEGAGVGLLSPEQYMEHLAAAWPVAQRTIKGQLNEDD